MRSEGGESTHAKLKTSGSGFSSSLCFCHGFADGYR
jgi:hypothetical protein